MAEVIVRIETAEGMKGYIIDGDAFGASVGAFYKDNINNLHPMLQPIVKGFIFALRHGPLQKLMREEGMPPLCKECPDKDAQAIGALAGMFAHSAHKAQAQLTKPGEPIVPIDMMQRDLVDASANMIRRAPQFDGPLPTAIEEPHEDSIPEPDGRYIDSAPAYEATTIGPSDGRLGWHTRDATYGQN